MKSKLKSGPCFFDQIPSRWRGEELQCMLSPLGKTVFVVKGTIEHYMCVGNLRDALLPWTPSDTCSSPCLLAEFLFVSKDSVGYKGYVPDRMLEEFAKLIAANPAAKRHIMTPDEEFDSCEDEQNPIKSDRLRMLHAEARRYAPSGSLRSVALNILAQINAASTAIVVPAQIIAMHSVAPVAPVVPPII